MARNIDYSKIKALSQQLLECIGDYPEGEDPSLAKPDNAFNNGGQKNPIEFLKADKSDPEEGEELSEEEDETDGMASTGKKKKKDSAIALMGSMLASKFNK